LTVAPAPLGFEWQSLTSTVLTNPNEEDQYNLSAGWYDVVITDNNGCEYIKRFNVQQYMTPVINGDFANPEFDNNNSTAMMINNVGNNNTTRSNRNIAYDSMGTEVNLNFAPTGFYYIPQTDGTLKRTYKQ